MVYAIHTGYQEQDFLMPGVIFYTLESRFPRRKLNRTIFKALLLFTVDFREAGECIGVSPVNEYRGRFRRRFKLNHSD